MVSDVLPYNKNQLSREAMVASLGKDYVYEKVIGAEKYKIKLRDDLLVIISYIELKNPDGEEDSSLTMFENKEYILGTPVNFEKAIKALRNHSLVQ